MYKIPKKKQHVTTILTNIKNVKNIESIGRLLDNIPTI